MNMGVGHEYETKSTSYECSSMFGLGGFCRAYRSLVSRRHHHDKKKNNPSPNKPQQETFNSNSLDQTCKVSNDKKGERTIHDELRLCNGEQGTLPPHEDDPNSHNNKKSHFTFRPSPLSRSSSPTSLSTSLSRSGRFPTPSGLIRSLSRHNAETHEGGSSLLRSSSSRKADSGLLAKSSTRKAQSGLLSKSLSRSGSVGAAHGGSLSRSSSRRGAIMYSNSNGLMKLPAIEKSLECSLEELCFGCVKRIVVKRDVVSSSGQIVEEEETLTIKVKPGWTKGTKITFEGTANEAQGTYSTDIVFVIVEKKHPLFRREGDDLELAVKIPLVDALTGCTLLVPMLGGGKMSVMFDEIMETGYTKIIGCQGMPKSTELGSRGNLIMKFLVEFPKELTEEQRSQVFGILQDTF